MGKVNTEKYDYGIYNGIGIAYDYTDKKRNVRNNVLYMLNRTLQMFEYTGLPDTIPARELERLVQTNGYAGITEVEGELYAFFGGLGGEPNPYGRATTLVVSNPALRFNKTLTIDEDVILMRNDDMQVGIIPILTKYSTMMNENEITIILNLITKRVNNLISVADDNTAESAKLFLKKIEEGELGYIFENKLFSSLKTSDFGKDSADISELIELQQYLKAHMYNEVGLNANPNMKKERMITSEIEVNSESLYPLVDNMLDSRREAVEKINEKYDTQIHVEFSSSWNYRINQGEKVTQETMRENQELENQQGLGDIFGLDEAMKQDEDVARQMAEDFPTDSLRDDGEINPLLDEETYPVQVEDEEVKLRLLDKEEEKVADTDVDVAEDDSETFENDNLDIDTLGVAEEVVEDVEVEDEAIDEGDNKDVPETVEMDKGTDEPVEGVEVDEVITDSDIPADIPVVEELEDIAEDIEGIVEDLAGDTPEEADEPDTPDTPDTPVEDVDEPVEELEEDDDVEDEEEEEDA